MTQATQGEVGNTESTSLTSRYRKWCFTLNNYDEKDLEIIDTKTHEYSNLKFIVGKEIGESGTPHLQGYLEFKNAISMKSLKKWLPRAHLEKARGSSKQNYDYCSKAGDFRTNMFPDLKKRLLEELYHEVEWRNWQQNILNILDSTPHQRTIHWIYDEVGNKGKSYLCKYIFLKYHCIVAQGKSDNIFNQVLRWREHNPEELQIPPILVDISRGDYSHVNYSAIESVKNGFLYSGKYEGGVVFGKNPHVFIFSNCEPDLEQFSQDRWELIHI